MKHYDNFAVGLTKRPVRKSMEELGSTGKYTFKSYGRKYFVKYKERFTEMQEKAGFNDDDYRQWLLKSKLTDNITNRNKFLLHKPDRTANGMGISKK
jgi:hypothetical protein